MVSRGFQVNMRFRALRVGVIDQDYRYDCELGAFTCAALRTRFVG